MSPTCTSEAGPFNPSLAIFLCSPDFLPLLPSFVVGFGYIDSCSKDDSYTMASIARQSPLLRQSGLSAIRSPLLNRNAVGASQLVAFHASAKKQILPPLPRE